MWFGEAKFYNDISDHRLEDVIISVNNSLSTGKLKKENTIIINLNEIDEQLNDNQDLIQKIKNILNGSVSMDTIRPKIHIPILLLYECKITEKATCFSDEYKQKIKQFHQDRAISYFSKQIEKIKDSVHMYDKITFHIILFPVPSKTNIVERFVKKATFDREGD